MRVMYLCVSAEMGGAERSLFDILASLRRAQPTWPLHLVTAADGPLVRMARDFEVSASVLPFPPSIARLGEAGASDAGMLALGAGLVGAALRSRGYVRGIRHEIRVFEPDVIHTNSLKMHLLGAAAVAGRRQTARPSALVWHMHDYIGTRPMTARLLRWRRRACATVIANSASVADDVRRVLGEEVPVATVLNAVDLDRFAGNGACADLDALAGLPPAPPGTVKVGLVSTFGRWKGHTTFLDAVARLPRELPVRAYVVGGALYSTAGSQHTLDDLRRYALRAGIADRVGFTGFVAHADEAMRALDVVVHASTAPEPFGLVIAEAMACARAVVASDAGGAREVFTSGVDALAHAPGDAGELAARVEQLALDASERRRLGSAGRRTAIERFDRARLARDLGPLYEKAAAVGRAFTRARGSGSSRGEKTEAGS
jgi:glycosyltransferase involved in cell wall biosynthesis